MKNNGYWRHVMENNVGEFVKWIRNSDNIVFFGGAGVST